MLSLQTAAQRPGHKAPVCPSYLHSVLQQQAPGHTSSRLRKHPFQPEPQHQRLFSEKESKGVGMFPFEAWLPPEGPFSPQAAHSIQPLWLGGLPALVPGKKLLAVSPAR